MISKIANLYEDSNFINESCLLFSYNSKEECIQIKNICYNVSICFYKNKVSLQIDENTIEIPHSEIKYFKYLKLVVIIGLFLSKKKIYQKILKMFI